MTTTPSPTVRQQGSRRRRAVVAGSLLVAAGAAAVPALALSRSDEAGASTPATILASVTTVAPSTTVPAPEATPAAVPAPDPAAVFAAWWDAATPEQRAAFQLMTASPEQLAAFAKFVTPPPPPAPKPKVTVTRQAPAARGGGAPGGFLSCVRNRESRGNYNVVNGSSGAGGAYQFMPQTWNNVARHAGRSDLVGTSPSQASAADQDAMAQALYQWQGAAPWGGGC